MVWEDWAEIRRTNPGRAMLNLGRHNAQCLPLWKQAGPMLSAGCASRAHVEPLGPSWAYGGPGWAYVGLCWDHLGPMLGLCWAHVGLCWPYVAPC
jgi:hypothetical protein